MGSRDGGVGRRGSNAPASDTPAGSHVEQVETHLPSVPPSPVEKAVSGLHGGFMP